MSNDQQGLGPDARTPQGSAPETVTPAGVPTVPAGAPTLTADAPGPAFTPGAPGTAAFNPQGPQAYQSGAGYPGAVHPSWTPQPAAPLRNKLAVWALGIAIAGFVFAVIPGAFIIGWMLLPLGFILSLVALFRQNFAKKAAVAALVVSIVGTMAGGIAFTATLAAAVDDALNEQPKVVQGEPAAKTDDTKAGEAAAQAGNATAEEGTRENPLPLRSTIETDDWRVTVNSFTADATKAVLAANPFNDKPAAGTTYALVNVTVTYLGEKSGRPAEVSVEYVTNSGNVIDGTENLAVAPKALNSLAELYPNAKATGNVALQIPKGDAGTIRVSPGFFADDAFFALS